MTDCVFCDPLHTVPGEVEQHFAADGSVVWAFEPIDPVTSGHMLVVPKAHVGDATEEPLVTAMVAGVAARVAQRHRSANIITSIGTPATQSVFHLHLHVVPRHDGDGLHLPWTNQKRRS